MYGIATVDKKLYAGTSGNAIVKCILHLHPQLLVCAIALRKTFDGIILIIVKIGRNLIVYKKSDLRTKIEESLDLARAKIDVRQQRYLHIGKRARILKLGSLIADKILFPSTRR